jgi:hypothetical protein
MRSRTGSAVLRRAARVLFAVLEARDTKRSIGRPASVGPTHVARLANGAGLDPVAIYRGADGSDRFAAAARAAGKRVDVRRPGIDVTVSSCRRPVPPAGPSERVRSRN